MKIVDWVYQNRKPRIYEKQSPTLRAGKCRDLYVLASPKSTGTPAKSMKPDSNKQTICVGSTQKNAGVMQEQAPALTEAMGKGGGHVPMIYLAAQNASNSTEATATAQQLSLLDCPSSTLSAQLSLPKFLNCWQAGRICRYKRHSIL